VRELMAFFYTRIKLKISTGTKFFFHPYAGSEHGNEVCGLVEKYFRDGPSEKFYTVWFITSKDTIHWEEI
jgi:hypothetical protein